MITTDVAELVEPRLLEALPGFVSEFDREGCILLAGTGDAPTLIRLRPNGKLDVLPQGERFWEHVGWYRVPSELDALVADVNTRLAMRKAS